MLFPTTIFMFVFAPITLIGYWLIKDLKWKWVWLTCASYVFYGYWNYWFTSLLFAKTLINYIAAIAIKDSPDPAKKKLWLVLSLVASLGLLYYFKYFMLTLNTVNAVSEMLGGEELIRVWKIILPIGVSFFTFQAISYTIDVYKEEVEPTRDFIEFMCYAALFPQLIAGPIVRYVWIKKTIQNLPTYLSTTNLNLGLFYFTVGLVKKVLIADRIAYYIDPMFVSYKDLAPVESWLMMIGYSFQLYFDFAGYSLMAIGLGHLMGFEFPQNFNSPYKAVSISDFWRRWHMTLSSWLRDYLYIPLGGRNNRAIALAVTMLLGGLWHGAYWTFLVWGAYHAVLLELHHHFKGLKWFPKNIVWARIGTFLLVTIGWVFFRPPTFESAWTILKTMFDIPAFFAGAHVQPELVVGIVIAGAWAMFAPNAVELIREKKAQPRTSWAVALGILTAICVLLFSESGPFLYFQF